MLSTPIIYRYENNMYCVNTFEQYTEKYIIHNISLKITQYGLLEKDTRISIILKVLQVNRVYRFE